MGWNQLLEMAQRNRQSLEEVRSQPPVACPIDGMLLQVNSKGERNCPMGNYTWRG